MLGISIGAAALIFLVICLTLRLCRRRPRVHMSALLSFLVVAFVLAIVAAPGAYDAAGGGGALDSFKEMMLIVYTLTGALLIAVLSIAIAKRAFNVILVALAALALAAIPAFGFWYMRTASICCITELANCAPSPSISADECVYFSTITFATVGYGALVPYKPIGRALASIEALLGLIHLGIFVSALFYKLRPR